MAGSVVGEVAGGTAGEVAGGVAGGPRDSPVMLVVATTSGGTGAHVRMLAAGLAARGIAVSVAGPPAADRVFSFGALPSVAYLPVAIGDRPRVGDLAALLRLRRLLVRWAAGGSRGTAAAGRSRGTAAAGGSHGAGSAGGVVHAHGLRAGAFAALALAGGRRRVRVRVRLVVTVHNAPPVGGRVSRLVYRVLAGLVASGADLVLCVSPDLEEAMRAAGARRVAPAVVAAPAPAPAPVEQLRGLPVGQSLERPMVLAVGRLTGQKGFETLLDAAVRWQDLEPRAHLAIAGDGPLAGKLRAKAAALAVDASFLGQVGNVPAFLARAAVFVLPSWWEGQPLVLQEALRAGVPIVATRVGGVPDLVRAVPRPVGAAAVGDTADGDTADGEAADGDTADGEAADGEAALLVEPGDAAALAAAVRAVLTEPALAARLRAAAARRAWRLPAEADAVAAALAAYAPLRGE